MMFSHTTDKTDHHTFEFFYLLIRILTRKNYAKEMPVSFNQHVEMKFYLPGSAPICLSSSTLIQQKTRLEKNKFKCSVLGFQSQSLITLQQECLYNKLYLWITVPNLDYEKEIRFRYTSSHWSTYDDLIGQYVESFTDLSTQCQYDTFVCVLDLNPNQFQHYEFCIQYRYGSREYWANNDGRNYTMDVWRTEVLKIKKRRPCLNEMDLRRVPFHFVL
jgi:hypothetical protein